MNHDYYDILNVHPTASQNEIERAYRKASLKVHPDKSSDKNAERDAAFRYVNFIKNTLSSPVQRSVYDKTRDISRMRAEGEVAEIIQAKDLCENMECRCGGIYEFSEAEISSFTEFFKSNEIPPTATDSLPTLLQCNSCSLMIRVNRTQT